MPQFPITGNLLYDCVIAGIILVAGFAIMMKAGNKWGVILIVIAAIWAFLLVKDIG